MDAFSSFAKYPWTDRHQGRLRQRSMWVLYCHCRWSSGALLHDVGHRTGRKTIETIEGLAPSGKLNPIQEAWLDEYGAQCGFCSPGMIMSSKALLDRNPNPSEREIRKALAGNICICSNYEHIVSAVKLAADKMERSKKNA